MKPDQRQMDALKELLNIGVGNGAGVLSTMLGTRIELQVPEVRMLDPGENGGMSGEFGPNELSSVVLGFEGPFAGSAGILFPTNSASRLVTAVVGDNASNQSLDTLRSGTLTEVGNIVLNGVMGSFGNILDQDLKYIVPYYFEGKASDLFKGETYSNTVLLLAKTLFSVAEMEIGGSIILLLEVASFDLFSKTIDNILSREEV